MRLVKIALGNYSGAELVVNVSASPFRVGVVSTRRERAPRLPVVRRDEWS